MRQERPSLSQAVQAFIDNQSKFIAEEEVTVGDVKGYLEQMATIEMLIAEDFRLPMDQDDWSWAVESLRSWDVDRGIALYTLLSKLIDAVDIGDTDAMKATEIAVRALTAEPLIPNLDFELYAVAINRLQAMAEDTDDVSRTELVLRACYYGILSNAEKFQPQYIASASEEEKQQHSREFENSVERIKKVESPIVLAANIVRQADSEILSKDALVVSDVETYLKHLTSALKLASPGARHLIIAAVEDWDTNRGTALLALVEQVYLCYKAGDIKKLEVFLRCAMTIVEEPLYPSLDASMYVNFLERSAQMIQKETGINSHKPPLSRALHAGIVYNQRLFLPQISGQAVSEQDVNSARNKYYDALSRLQGKPPTILQ